MPTIKRSLQKPDVLAVVALILLWALFFWRLLTPIAVDQASLRSGDFSRQFFTFASYQYERFAAGEVPLWNPYNNGGLPFIADTQAAVFYPPRLATIFISKVLGGWTYNALQIEMAVHVLAYTLFMYAFVRRLTLGNSTKGVYAGFAAAVIAGYGGFMTGYPPLQLALLEAGIWLPLALLSVSEANRTRRLGYRWFAFSGVALGLSWMAGHPQTSWFATYLTVAYIGFHIYLKRLHWTRFVIATGITGVVTVGIAAIQLLPGIEYLALTMRTDFGFDQKAGGFPVQDVVQFLYPGVMSLYSPLYIGITGLILAIFGVLGRHKERFFWLVAALIALALSLGENGVLFHAAYNFLPGLRFFRGQERAAYLVANSLAVLAGLGIISIDMISRKQRHRISFLLSVFLIIMASGVFILWLGDREAYADSIGAVVFSAIVSIVYVLILITNKALTSRLYLLLAGLIIFELFSVNMDNVNYDSIPASQQSILQPRPLLDPIRADPETPFRVDGGLVGGEIGIFGDGNTGSLYQIEDIRGISPLFLDGAHAIIQRESPAQVAWEVFAVKYVFDDDESLPVESQVIGTDVVEGITYFLHEISDPRPFTQLVYDYEVLDSDEFARALLADPAFDARNTLILDQEPEIAIQSSDPGVASVEITEYQPENITLQVAAEANGLLSLALVDYPGWVAYVDGERVEKFRAYGSVTALEIPAGEHTVKLRYESQTYRIGATLTLLTTGALFILAMMTFINGRRSHARHI